MTTRAPHHPVVAALPLRSPWSTWCQVVGALVLRELRTRFGQRHLGAVWLLVEPVLGSLVMVTLIGMRHPLGGGLNSIGFVIPGFVCWGMIRNLFTALQHAPEANQGLFAYRQVLPLTTMVARALLESCLSLVVYLILIGLCTWWGQQVGTPHPLELLACWLLLTALGAGFGLLLSSLETVAPPLARACNIGLRPLMWVSGVFYSVAAMPTEWQRYVLWNPILHAIELVRVQQFGSAYSTPANWQLPAACALGLVTLGLLAYRATWRRMVSS